MNYLEQHLTTKILGICGVEFLKTFQWIIDYKKQIIYLYPLSKNGQVLDTPLPIPSEILKLGNIKHLLYVEARVGVNLVRLGLDTGASTSLLTHNSVEYLADYLTLTNTSKTTTIIGICGSKEVSDQYILSQLRISNKMIINSKVITGSLSRINKWSKIKLDGLFNPITLGHHVIGLNWKKQQLYIWCKWDWPGTEALVNLDLD